MDDVVLPKKISSDFNFWDKLTGNSDNLKYTFNFL